MTHRGPFQPLTFCDSVKVRTIFSELFHLQIGYNVTGISEDTLVLEQQKMEKNLAPEEQVYININRLQRDFQVSLLT